MYYAKLKLFLVTIIASATMGSTIIDPSEHDQWECLQIEIVEGNGTIDGRSPGVYQIVEGEASLVVPLEASEKDKLNAQITARNLKRIYAALNAMGIKKDEILEVPAESSTHEHGEVIHYVGFVATEITEEIYL